MFSRVLYTYDNGKTAKVEYYVPLDGEEELSNYEQYFTKTEDVFERKIMCSAIQMVRGILAWIHRIIMHITVMEI